MKKQISSIGEEHSDTHTREPFAPDELVFNVGASESAPITGVIFSKDRPLQLDGTLRSFFGRCQDTHQCRLKVLYRASEECQPHYDTLIQEYTTVEFIAEQDFRNDLLHLLSSSELVLFLVDDNLFVRDFPLAEVAGALRQQPAALGFSLRLGRNTTFCYPFNKSQNLPPFETVAPQVLSCDWTKAEGDFNYPLEVSSSVYRTADVLPLLRESFFQNPNTLESELAARASQLTGKPQLLCFEVSRAFCNPINIVQRICPNRTGGLAEHYPEQLARQFGVGMRLDVEAYKDFTPTGCHEEVPLHLVLAAVPTELAVSIVVPCFKQAHYLPDAIQSVLAQTFTDWEVIIVNDGSPDDTSRVAQELIARHPEQRIRLLEITNGGPGRARNAGIREARGKFILPLDADDQVAPEFLAKTVAYLEAQPDVPIVSTYRKDFGLADQVHPVSDYTLAMILEDNRLNYCSLYRREIWQSVGGYDPARAIGYEDWSFWISCAERGWFARCISEPLFLYRVKSESRFTETQARDAIQRAQIVLRHAASYPPQQVAAAQRVVEQASMTAPVSQKIPAPLPSGPAPNCPTASVIVPTFNRPAMLLETLRSILTQSYQDFEIIVINDAGEDVTAALATLGDIQKIRHLRHKENKGLAAARNTGIKAARGKYIAYLDDDDIFQSNHLQTLVEHLEATQGDVAYTDAYRAHQRKNGDAYEVFARDVPYSFEFNYDRILEKNFIPVLCFMHRKTCWEAVGGFDESLPVLEDWDLWIRMSRLYDFTHIAKVTCEFRWRTDGSTMSLACNEKFARTKDIIMAKLAHLPARRNAAGSGLGERPIDRPMSPLDLQTQNEFDELAYLRANPDVAAAVLTHALESGWQHYVKYGSAEQRPWFRNETTSAEAEASPFCPAQTS
jgi:glycosyltransferase involved in cell wall biosynthesis